MSLTSAGGLKKEPGAPFRPLDPSLDQAGGGHISVLVANSVCFNAGAPGTLAHEAVAARYGAGLRSETATARATKPLMRSALFTFAYWHTVCNLGEFWMRMGLVAQAFSAEWATPMSDDPPISKSNGFA